MNTATKCAWESSSKGLYGSATKGEQVNTVQLNLKLSFWVFLQLWWLERQRTLSPTQGFINSARKVEQCTEYSLSDYSKAHVSPIWGPPSSSLHGHILQCSYCFFMWHVTRSIQYTVMHMWHNHQSHISTTALTHYAKYNNTDINYTTERTTEHVTMGPG